MKSYSAYQAEITQYKDIIDTVRAIEKISGAYIKLMQNSLAVVDEYTTALLKIISQLNGQQAQPTTSLTQPRESGTKVLVLFCGNKGLIGKLYTQLQTLVLQNADVYQNFIAIGDMARRALSEAGIAPTQQFAIQADIPADQELHQWFEYVVDLFYDPQTQQIDILSPDFTSLAEQRTTLKNFLPFRVDNLPVADDVSANDGFPIYEPRKNVLIQDLVNEYIESAFHKIIVQAKLAEFSARGIVTENASQKSETLVTKLVHNYFKDRRRDITQKQLESFSVHNLNQVTS